MVLLCEFVIAMKTVFRYSLIIFTLGIFSSCAEQFREIRGSQNQGNAFFGGGLTSSTATKRTDKAKGETVTPHQTVINVEQTVTEPVAENTPDANPFESKIEKAETNQAHAIQGQKSSVSGKGKKGQFHFLQKTKLLKPGKILKKSLSQKGNQFNINLYELGKWGIICSIIGGLILLSALSGEGLLLVTMLFFLLSLISSIWLFLKPTWEDANTLKNTAIVFAVLSVLMGLLILLGLIVGANLFYPS
jgi:hypothetical protein